MIKTTIYFKYGCMNSGKSLELMKVSYNYEENNIIPLVLKPKIDSRESGKVISRTGLKKEAYEIETIQDLQKIEDKFSEETKVILIDEAQFLSIEVIDLIVKYAYDNHVGAVMFFGLKSDFRGNLFEGSKRIIEVADKIEESTSICWCGKKARQNARVVNGKITKDGPTILVEDGKNIVEYITLCNYHYFKGQIKGSIDER